MRVRRSSEQPTSPHRAPTPRRAWKRLLRATLLLGIAACGQTIARGQAETDALADAGGVTDGPSRPAGDATASDDGQQLDSSHKIAFISSGRFSSALDAGEPTPRADAICDAEGKLLKPQSTFRAWISTSATNAKD